MEDKKLPEHSQRRFCFYELRGGVHEFASAASKLLNNDGKFCTSVLQQTVWASTLVLVPWRT